MLKPRTFRTSTSTPSRPTPICRAKDVRLSSRTHASPSCRRSARESPSLFCETSRERGADGGALIDFVFRVADIDQVPVYIEGAPGKNATIYGKKGFETKVRGVLDKWWCPQKFTHHGGMHVMVRPVQPPATP